MLQDIKQNLKPEKIIITFQYPNNTENTIVLGSDENCPNVNIEGDVNIEAEGVVTTYPLKDIIYNNFYSHKNVETNICINIRAVSANVQVKDCIKEN